jgi:hypothetical protein
MLFDILSGSQPETKRGIQLMVYLSFSVAKNIKVHLSIRHVLCSSSDL